MRFTFLQLAMLLSVVSVAGCTSCQRRNAVDTPIPEGEACEADDRCETGLCDVSAGSTAKTCLRPCAQGCRNADICTELGGGRYACVAEKAGLCKACNSDSDCPQAADKCLKLGLSSFCGRDCSLDDTCPSSYRCADATTVSGGLAKKQCQPTSGTCECTSATAGLQKPCEVTNAAGSCSGVSVCRPPMGFDSCSARTPTAEVCNGIDDDCNSRIDEGLGDLHCGMGECARSVAACVNGAAQNCTPGTPTTEVCNNRDDDCNGTVDDGFNTMTNVLHCGLCNNACAFAHAMPKCEAGVCGIDQCAAGWTNADGVMANGCEYPCTATNGGTEICDGLDNDCNGITDDGFNLVTDPRNCGQCNLVCALPNAGITSYACVARVCAVGTCAAGRGDCNQNYADGCEVNINTDLLHCGSCGMPCSTPNATPSCDGGTCGVRQCNPNFANCNNVVSDGCEVNTQTSVLNCGMCGRACSAAHATSDCMLGACTFTCDANWWDADGNPANGCEYACVQTQGGIEVCDGIDNNCNNRVDEGFDLTSNPSHCGMCNRACTAPSANTVCTMSNCAIGSCVAGKANCNNMYADGCETDTATGINNCGACGSVCSTNNIAVSCGGGQCNGACNAGFADCDNNKRTNGCEVNTNTSLANCGACGRNCTTANATPTCNAGMCAISSCSPGYADCNSMASDGCETNLAGNVDACNACGTVCPTRANASRTCGTSCGYACNPGYVDLDGLASTGCEYTCTASPGPDLPDLNNIDSDCDGIDGTLSASVFVDGINGSDGNSGLLPSAPKQTIAAGIAAAQASVGRRSVLIGEATYSASVALVSGISLYGGYRPASGWTRSTSPSATAIVSPNNLGVTGRSLLGSLELQRLTVVAQNAVGDAASSIGVLLQNAGTVTISGCDVRAGAGSAAIPLTQAAESDGAPGDPGTAAPRALDGVSDYRTPGTGGSSTCNAGGGAGGAGTRGNVVGNRGVDGSTAPGGAAGSPGSAPGTNQACGGQAAGGPGSPVLPNPADDGPPGANAAQGPSVGSFNVLGVYVPASGLPGGVGRAGGGGGGGGSGGSTARRHGFLCPCGSESDSDGATMSGGGGGGGAGGCGGAAGRGGKGGGGSFGVVSISSSVSVVATLIQTASGGQAQSGSSGGRGGTGGSGASGSGGETVGGGLISCAVRFGGTGAAGGQGGRGGAGGGGGGGPGGPSACVVSVGAAPTVTGGSCAHPAQGGPGGSGGLGDTSNAATGPAGLATDLIQL